MIIGQLELIMLAHALDWLLVRGSGDLEWGGNKCIWGCTGEECMWESLSRYGMCLQSPRWLLPQVAQPQVPPFQNRKRAKSVSVCALTQRDLKQRQVEGV